MGYDAKLSSDKLVLRLTGWDRLANLRRRFTVDLQDVREVWVTARSELEQTVDHRVLGVGTHDGDRRPNRRRVGTMLGRGVVGKQFWAVPAGSNPQPLLVVDLSEKNDQARIVLQVDDPDGFAAGIRERMHHP